MSEMVKYRGTIRFVPPLDGESFDDQCKRLWVLHGKSLDDYEKNELFNEFYKKYLKLKIRDEFRVYEYITLEKKDPDESFCTIVGDEQLMNFETLYYNGGASTDEMLQACVDKNYNKKV